MPANRALIKEYQDGTQRKIPVVILRPGLRPFSQERTT